MQLERRVRGARGKLTNDAMTAIQRDRAVLVGRRRERYGHTREEVEQAFDGWFLECVKPPGWPGTFTLGWSCARSSVGVESGISAGGSGPSDLAADLLGVPLEGHDHGFGQLPAGPNIAGAAQ
jgi:uncharacterized protein YjbJ (UPF0337 family)